MSWRKIPMKFSGVCTVCNKEIAVGEIGMWAKELGVKHLECAKIKDLPCIICGEPAGCPKCEYADDCNLELVSQMCICKACLTKDSYDNYRAKVQNKFLSKSNS